VDVLGGHGSFANDGFKLLEALIGAPHWFTPGPFLMKEREEGRGIENPTLQREEARLLAARRVDVEFDG